MILALSLSLFILIDLSVNGLLCNTQYFIKTISNTQLKASNSVNVADLLISSAFSIKPLFRIAADKARSSMIQQGLSIGVDWDKNVANLQGKMGSLESDYNKLFSSNVQYPDYYLKPFHAYDDGNLSWKAALEVESAALTVHAHIFSNNAIKNRELSRDGDFMLRDNFHVNMKKMFVDRSFNPTSILDLGCSTGLSTLKLHDSFPTARVIGMDLSVYFLAVANQNLLDTPSDASKLIEYKHGLAESTGLSKGEVDMVTMSLVAHELPTSALK